MTKPQLSWHVLDECRTPDDIAALLCRAGIRGVPDDPDACPLARATGWRVFGGYATRGSAFHKLTGAEFRFTLAVDAGDYPDLIESEKTNG